MRKIINITQSEQQRENRLGKKINRASEIFGTKTKDISSESQKEKREGRVGKILEEIMVRIQIWQ